MTAIRLYHTWFRHLRHLRPGEHTARVRSLSWLLVGVLLSHSVHLRHIARWLPGAAQQTSKERRLRRLLANGALRVRAWYQPIALRLLAEAAASGQPLRLLVDGSKIGFDHQLLMVALAYRRRALPLAWTWVRKGLGHSDAAKQCALLAYVQTLLPTDAQVLLVGDNEFGAVAVMRLVTSWQWHYVLRQKGQTTLRTDDQTPWQRLDSLVTQAGQQAWLSSVQFTQRHGFGSHLLAYWQVGEKEPWLLTTNLPTPQQTLRTYRYRMWIEGLFADFKGQGFDLEATHLRHVQRLSRLTLVVALLYVELVSCGAHTIKRGLRSLVDRTDRRDLSVFRIGLEMTYRCLLNDAPLVLRLCPYFHKSVR
jgi:hypothetical protein